MAVTREQMDQKMEEHFGFEVRDDIEGVLSTLTPDAVHDIVGWPSGPSHDHESIRRFYEAMYSDLAEGQVTGIRRLYGDGFLIDESLWKGVAVGAPFGVEGRGRPLQFRLLHVVEFTESGQMRSEQVWVDMAAIIRQLPKE
jgi:predicted ester cyclase